MKKAQSVLTNRRLLNYLWQQKKDFFSGVFLETLAVVSELGAPLIVAYLLNHELKEGVGAKDPAFYFKLIALYFVLMVLGAVLRYAAGYQMQRTANGIAMNIQNDAYRHVQKLPIAFFDRLPAGKVVSRITNDSKTLKNLFSNVFVKILTAAIYAVVIYLNLLILDWRLFILALIPTPILYWGLKEMHQKGSKYSYNMRRQISEMNGVFNESIVGMEVIQSLGREERMEKDFTDLNWRLFHSSRSMTKLYSYCAFNLSENVQYLMLAMVLALFAYCSFNGYTLVALGSLYVFVDYTHRIAGQFNQILQRINTLERSRAAAEHLFELLEEPTVEERTGELAAIEGSISFENLSFAYLEDDVLKDFRLDIRAGESVAFVGPTGSGKTTIMNLLLGFYQPREGRVKIDGRPLQDYPLVSLRRQMAIVLQDPFLFQGTIYDNIALDRPEITPEMAAEALRQVGGGDFLEHLSEGIQARVDEGGLSFSAGERQLISFARALAQNPRILILDEATANVDSETEAVIQKAVEALGRGRTMLVIAHRLSTIRDMDRICVLEQGRLIEQGSHAELLAKDGLYAKMHREQAR